MERKNSRQVRNNIGMLNYITNKNLEQETGSKDREELAEKTKFEYYDSSIETFEQDFKNVLEPYENFNEYLKKVYSSKIGKLIGIELGGPGVNFFKGIEFDIFKKTAGFTLKKLPEHFNQIHHEVVEADVFSKIIKHGLQQRSWNEVLNWIKENGQPDFIIERMVGPLFSIRTAKLFIIIFDRWYRVLADEGSMFIEVPRDFKHDIFKKPRIDYNLVYEFLNRVKKNNPNILLKISKPNENNVLDENRFVIYLKKLKGAPASLKKMVDM